MMKDKIYVRFLLILSAVLTLLFGACEDSTVPVKFGLPEDELVFPADGGEFLIELSAPEEWSVSCDREWCMVTPVNGHGSALCEIRVDSSYLYNEREAHLNFRCGKYSRLLTVKQFGYEKVIRLDRTEIEVPDFTDYDALYENVKVESNVNYDVFVEYADGDSGEWLSVDKPAIEAQSVPRPGIVRIGYKMYMDSTRDREATLVFRQNDARQGETPVENRLVFRQRHAQEIVPSREGDSLALLALSRIMHVSTSWVTSQPMIYWNNIKLEDVTYFNTKLNRTVTEPRVTELSFTLFETDGGIPYQIQYLDQLRVLMLTGNSNAHTKRLQLGADVCKLKNLKVLSLVGYGLTSLPDEMAEMDNLEELELSGNNFTHLPMEVIKALDKKKLWYINFANNRRRDVFARLYENAAVRDTLGLYGAIPEELFQLKNIRHIGLSYNYFEGELPTMDYDASQYATLEEKVAHNPVMPQLEQLSINLNYFTGKLPDWILYHPNLRCWDPYTLVFNQFESSRDSKGRNIGFDNEPVSVGQPCRLWGGSDEESNEYYETRPFNRKNTFDPSVMYDILRGETVYRNTKK